MNFDKTDLQQLTTEYLEKLPTSRVLTLFGQLREDLLRAHERLLQNPSNSSRPSSTRDPWNRGSGGDHDNKPDEGDPQPDAEPDHSDDDSPQGDEPSPDQSTESDQPKGSGEGDEPKKKPGRQPGSQGFGRT